MSGRKSSSELIKRQVVNFCKIVADSISDARIKRLQLLCLSADSNGSPSCANSCGLESFPE